MACLSGVTARLRQAMNATPASTVTGLSQPFVWRTVATQRVDRLTAASKTPCAPRRHLDIGTRHQLDNGACHARGAGGNEKEGIDHAQWPCHTQWLALSATPLATLSSHGRGGRRPARARIRSSPSAPGSTWPTAADSAFRSVFSRLSSDAVMPSPACPLRHDVSCSKIDRSADIPRAVWLFTAPRLIPMVPAISASERSA